MGVEELLDLARVDVLPPAPDHHVLDPADDVAVAVLAHRGQVAGVHPAVGVDGLGGLLRVLPVAQHDRVAPPRTQLTGFAPPRHRLPPGRVDHLDLQVRVDRADRAVRRSRSSSACVWHDTGLVSVIPYAIDTSVIPISVMQRFITSTGQGDPAMIPVRRLDRSKVAKSGGWLCIAMNIVGTPYTAVARSSWIAFRVAFGSKPGDGMIIVTPPCEVQPRFAITMPKQW